MPKYRPGTKQIAVIGATPFGNMSVDLREAVEKMLLPDVMLPAQYMGGELGSIVKEHVRHRFCLAFPDLYTIGMSHYGFQLLYSLINRREDWACERVFVPRPDMEQALRRAGLPLYSLETFTPLHRFDVLGFSLQYELSFPGVPAILDQGGIPLRNENRTFDHPLVVAGGPCVSNPEPMSRFIDLFVIGDGEETLPRLVDLWIGIRETVRAEKGNDTAARRGAVLELARRMPHVYAPAFYEVAYDPEGRARRPRPVEDGLPEFISPAVVADLDAYAPDALRIVPLIETVQDRIAVEIMRGCPGTCKFCQSNVLKRPIRLRSIDSIVRQSRDACEATGIRDVSLLSLSTSDYPEFESLIESLRTELEPLGASISVPSLRVNHQLSRVMETLSTERTGGLTLAPEAALDPMRRRIGKQVTNENLLAGCRSAFENGFHRVKMYFMVGLPEETEEDVEGILRLSCEIARLGKEVRGRLPTITTNVSNFIPKPHTPFERLGMRTGAYFQDAHFHLKHGGKLKADYRAECKAAFKAEFRAVAVKYHATRTSLLEGLLARGDRRLGDVIEQVYREGARLDAWSEYFQAERWARACEDWRIPVESIVHTPYPEDVELPWEHIRLGAVKSGLRL